MLEYMRKANQLLMEGKMVSRKRTTLTKGKGQFMNNCEFGVGSKQLMDGDDFEVLKEPVKENPAEKTNILGGLHKTSWVAFFPPKLGQKFFIEEYNTRAEAKVDARERQDLLERLGLLGHFHVVQGIRRE